MILTCAIAAMGVNLLTGFNGQISVGHGAFFGIGAYTTAILVADHGWPHFATLAVAAGSRSSSACSSGCRRCASRASTWRSSPSRWRLPSRSSSPGSAASPAARRASGFPGYEPPWTGLNDDQWKYYVLLAFAVVAYVLVRNLVKSRVGRALIATRDNETAAEVVGVHLAFYKVLTFGVSAMLAGIAGALSVFNEPFVNAEKYNINLSITLLVAVVVAVRRRSSARPGVRSSWS